MTASKATFTASGTQGRLVQSITTTNGAEYTASFYVKYGNKTTINFYSDAAVFGTFVTFNFTSNTITNSNNTYGSSVENVGNGWYRISFKTFAPSSTAQFGFITFGGEDGFCYIWGGQLESGATATTYQKTETRLNIPRLDYSNGTCPSLLVEPQRTNNVFWSNNFSTAKAYNYQNASQSSTTITAPDGLPTTGITSDTSSSIFHRFFKSVDASSNTFTSSIYAKQGTSRYLGLGVNHNGSASTNNIVVFDLQDGVIASNPYSIAATIELLSNGWYRLTHTYTYTGATAVDICVHNAGVSTYTTSGFQVFDSPTAPTTLYIFGLQFELGSYATSYIPTTSASVTRNADVISKTGISSLIGQTEGTIFADFWNYDNATNKSGWNICINGGGYGNAIYFEKYLGEWAALVWNGYNNQFAGSAGGALSIGRHKMAMAYKANDIAVYCDGVLVSTDTSASIPTCSRVDIGFIANDVTPEELGLNAAALWKTRLTNTQLAQLTTI
jgi:hypothetical protein